VTSFPVQKVQTHPTTMREGEGEGEGEARGCTTQRGRTGNPQHARHQRWDGPGGEVAAGNEERRPETGTETETVTVTGTVTGTETGRGAWLQALGLGPPARISWTGQPGRESSHPGNGPIPTQVAMERMERMKRRERMEAMKRRERRRGDVPCGCERWRWLRERKGRWPKRRARVPKVPTNETSSIRRFDSESCGIHGVESCGGAQRAWSRARWGCRPGPQRPPGLGSGCRAGENRPTRCIPHTSLGARERQKSCPKRSGAWRARHAKARVNQRMETARLKHDSRSLQPKVDAGASCAGSELNRSGRECCIIWDCSVEEPEVVCML